MTKHGSIVARENKKIDLISGYHLLHLHKRQRILLRRHGTILRIQHRVDYSQIFHASSNVAARDSRLPRILATHASAVTKTHARLYLHCILHDQSSLRTISAFEDSYIA